MVCYKCSYKHSKLIKYTAGNLINSNFLQFILITEIPHNLFITKSATTEIKGSLKKFIGVLKVIINRAKRDSIKIYNKDAFIDAGEKLKNREVN